MADTRLNIGSKLSARMVTTYLNVMHMIQTTKGHKTVFLHEKVVLVFTIVCTCTCILIVVMSL